MKLLIIRHGESEADLLDVHEGRADFSLTERGHRQADAMAAFVAEKYHITKIYSSTLKRAYQTAVHLSEASGAELTTDDNLMEFNNGLIAGLDRKTVEEKYPIIPDIPVHESVYEQESVLEFRFRADYILSEILSENPADSTVAVITHGGMINQLYRSFLRLPNDCGLFWNTGDTGIHEWVISNGTRRIVYSNRTAHTQGI